MKAYDYDAQEWVTGERARVLVLKQMQDEINALTGPEGVRYHLSTKKRGDVRAIDQRVMDAKCALLVARGA